MTKINFKDENLRCLVVDRILIEAVKLVESIRLENEVVLDFRGCFIDYGINKIMDYVLSQLKEIDGMKKVSIVHDLRITDLNQMAYYTYKKTTLFNEHFSDIFEYIQALKDNFGIELQIVGDSDAAN
jgi:hypothetical protein